MHVGESTDNSVDFYGASDGNGPDQHSSIITSDMHLSCKLVAEFRELVQFIIAVFFLFRRFTQTKPILSQLIKTCHATKRSKLTVKTNLSVNNILYC